MIVVCSKCRMGEQDGEICGMCNETLFGEELYEAQEEGCTCERLSPAWCEDCAALYGHSRGGEL